MFLFSYVKRFVVKYVYACILYSIYLYIIHTVNIYIYRYVYISTFHAAMEFAPVCVIWRFMYGFISMCT